MRKWYNLELSNKSEVDRFRNFLRSHGIKFETSDCSVSDKRIWHFEIYLSKTEFEIVENFLEKMEVNTD